MFARLHTGNWSLMTLGNGYHGAAGSHAFSNLASYNHEVPKTQGVEDGPMTDMFRCPFPKEDASRLYAEQLKR